MTRFMNFLVLIKLTRRSRAVNEITIGFHEGRTLKNCFAILDEAQNATETN